MLAHDSFVVAGDGIAFYPGGAFVITPAMTNRIAIGLGLFIIGFLALNFALGLEWHIFLGRKFLDLVRAIAFWR